MSTSTISTDNKAPGLVAVSAVFLGVTILSAGIRIFTRLRLVKWIGVDDILVLFAVAASVCMSASTIIATKYGLGRHIELQLPEWREHFAKADLAASMSYSVSAMFVKLSLLAFYLRLSPNPTFRALTYALVFLCTSFGVASVAVVPLQCTPIDILWDPTIPGHCIDINTFYFANAGIHIFTEILIYILPIHTLWALHLPLRQKLGLVGLMGIGAMLIVLSCYRIVTICDLLKSNDFTWSVCTPLMWYSIEINLAIFIACGPAFLAFFRHYLPSVFGGSSGRSHQCDHRTSYHKNSYPLGSVAHASYVDGHGGKGGGMKTTITGKTMGMYGEDNSSEEMIIRSALGSGIQKQVDVWIGNEEVKGDERSHSEGVEGGHAV